MSQPDPLPLEAALCTCWARHFQQVAPGCFANCRSGLHHDSNNTQLQHEMGVQDKHAKCVASTAPWSAHRSRSSIRVLIDTWMNQQSTLFKVVFVAGCSITGPQQPPLCKARTPVGRRSVQSTLPPTQYSVGIGTS